MFGPKALDDVLARADFVLVTTPLTPETKNLIDHRRLDLMKPTAGLINMSRAAVVDYQALAAKLRDGSLAGAILDVFEPEPLPSSSPHSPCSPHTALGVATRSGWSGYRSPRGSRTA